LGLTKQAWSHVRVQATDGMLGFCMSADLPDYHHLAAQAA
jgi:hypothetical protein